MTARELRLRRRIDQLTDERDAAVVELADVKEDIRIARSVAAKARVAAQEGAEGAHAWLAEYDRRKAARTARKRERVAEREAKDYLERREMIA